MHNSKFLNRNKFDLLAKNRWLKILTLFVIILLPSKKVYSQNIADQKAGTQIGYKDSPTNKITGYLVYLPKEYYDNPNKDFPMVVFFHGAGERGTNLDYLKRNGPPMMVNKGRDFPFILVSPQVQFDWKDADAIDILIEHVKSKLRVDNNRLYVTGLSLGGNGTFNYTFNYAYKVAASVPIAGWGTRSIACNAVDVPLWAFHNQGDRTVGVGGTNSMISALEKCGSTVVKKTIYPRSGHDAWTVTYNNEAMWEWMLSQSKDGTVPPPNKAPIANAGSDKTTTLPANSATLMGSGSDSDGSITAYQWAKINGPGVTMTDVNKADLRLTKLVEGVYTFKLTVTDNKGEKASDEVKVIVNAAVNEIPVANAGGDKTLTLPNNSISLSGTGEDSDGSITAYQWTKTDGPAVTLTDVDKATLKLSALVEGIYTFKLTVTDNNNAKASDDVKVTVNPAPQEPENQAPVAIAGSDQTITLPTNYITLKGTGSDADGSVTAYAWTKVDGPEATLNDQDKAELKLSNLVEGNYTFKLTVTDNEGEKASDQVKVMVNAAPQAPENQAPVANAGGDQTITLPTNYLTLKGTGSDADGSVTAYAWIKVDGPEVTLNDQDKADLKLSNLVEGNYTFKLSVTDNEGEKASDQVKVTVNPESQQSKNQYPIADAGSDQTITLPINSLTLYGSGSDPDGEIIAFEWIKVNGPEVTLTDQNKATLKLSNMVAGNYTFKLTVTDNEGETAFSEVKVTVNPEELQEPENQAPLANAGSDQTITLPTNSLTLRGSGSDPDGSVVTYEWLEIDGPATLIKNQDEADLELSNLQAGNYTFKLTVIDNKGAKASDIVKVTVKPAPNKAPIANAGEPKTLTLPNNNITLTGKGSDADGNITAYAWTKVDGPEVTMTDANKAILKLSGLTEGDYTFKLTVTDNDGAQASATVKVTVKPVPNKAPVANAGKDKTLTLPFNKIRLSGSGTDVDGGITVYKWTKVGGPAVTIGDASKSDLILSGLTSGTYTFKLTVTDNKGAKASDDVRIIVNNPPLANAGRDKTITLPTNATYLSGAGSDKDGTIVAYAWTKVSGPSVDMKDADTYLLLLSNLQEGTYAFSLEVTDSRGAKAVDEVKVIVLPAENVLPNVNAGRNQKIQLPSNKVTLTGKAVDPDGTISSYLWSQVAGPSASLAGVDSPTLQVSNLIEGTYTFKLTVKDNNGATAFDEIQIVVEKVFEEMKLSFNTSNNHCFGANEGHVEVSITGGMAPYTYYWTNGATSSTIADLGAGKYTVTVTDQKGNTKKATVTVTQPEELKVSADITHESNRGYDGKIAVKISGGTAPYEYEWSNGASNSSNNGLQSGNYTLVVRDANGCSVEQTYKVNKIHEFSTLIYPNPSHGKFNLKLDNLEATHYVVRVFDAQGVLIQEKSHDINAAFQVESLDLTGQQKGIYLIKIIYDNAQEETHRVIIN